MCSCPKVEYVPVNLHDKFQLLMVMIISSRRDEKWRWNLHHYDEGLVMKTTFFMEFSATDEIYQVLVALSACQLVSEDVDIDHLVK